MLVFLYLFLFFFPSKPIIDVFIYPKAAKGEPKVVVSGELGLGVELVRSSLSTGEGNVAEFESDEVVKTLQGLYDIFLTLERIISSQKATGTDEKSGKDYVWKVIDIIKTSKRNLEGLAAMEFHQTLTRKMVGAIKDVTGFDYKSVSTVMLIGKVFFFSGKLQSCATEVKAAITRQTELSGEIGAAIKASIKSGHEINLRELFMPNSATCDSALDVGNYDMDQDQNALAIDVRSRRKIRADLNKLEMDIRSSGLDQSLAD